MTKNEFERAYARRSGITVKQLHKLGRYAKPCNCGEEICEGWQITSKQREAEDTMVFGVR